MPQKTEKKCLLDIKNFKFLAIFYPSSVLASDVVIPLDFPLITLFYVFFMASWGALAAVLQRFSSGQDLKKWKLVIFKDLVNAVLAAFLTFLVCEHFGVPPILEAVAFTLAGYGGARFMESVYRKFVQSIKEWPK